MSAPSTLWFAFLAGICVGSTATCCVLVLVGAVLQRRRRIDGKEDL